MKIGCTLQGPLLVAMACGALSCGGPPEDDSVVLTAPAATIMVETNTSTETATEPCATPIDESGRLRESFSRLFRVGTAVPPLMFIPGSQALLVDYFNHLSPENSLEWTSIQLDPGQYAFGDADEFVAFGEEHGMTLYGHVLVWHQQVPRWAFDAERQVENPRECRTEEFLARLEKHVTTLAERYGGRIAYWDVDQRTIRRRWGAPRQALVADPGRRLHSERV